MTRHLLSTTRLAGTAAFALMAGSASAQDGAIDLGTLTIFGDRTAASFDQSRFSLAVVGRERLESPSVQDLRDTFSLAANVNDTDWSDSGFVIRGINSEGFTPGGEPLASVYVDGVEQTQDAVRRGARGLFDVEQVEVFRGPQSTLSGRAGLAGAIYVKTRDPSFDREGNIELTFGENGRRQVGVAFGDALGTDFAYRFALETSRADAEIDYPLYEGFDKFEGFARDEYWQGRFKLLWQPQDDTRHRLLLSLSRSFDSPQYNDIAGPDWAPGSGVDYDDLRGDYWGIAGAPAYQEARETWATNAGIDYSFQVSDALKLTSLTGWSASLTTRDSINAGTPGEVFTAEGDIDQTLLTQEFRLNYETDDLRGVAGLYFARGSEEVDRTSDPFPGRSDSVHSESDVTNLALFGEIDYTLLPGLSVIAGGRIDRFRRESTNFFARNGTVQTDGKTVYEETVFLPKVGLAYEFDQTQSVSLIYQQGYRPGGSAVQSTTGLQYDFDPEFTDTYELSWRRSFMEDRLAVSANLFWQTWRDQQVEILTDPADVNSARTVNAARSSSRGAELEATWRATDTVSVFGSLGHLDTRFDRFEVLGFGDYSGLPFPEAPERTAAIGVDWQGRNWFAGATVTYQSDSMSRLENFVADPVTLDARTLVDARVGYTFDNGNSVTLYGRNIFDEQYLTYENGPDVLATRGPGREIGVQANFRF